MVFCVSHGFPAEAHSLLTVLRVFVSSVMRYLRGNETLPEKSTLPCKPPTRPFLPLRKLAFLISSSPVDRPITLCK